MSQIKAEIVGDAISQSGNRITSFLLTYPRIIHSELMTHRVFSRSSSSSRAVKFEKMVEAVENNPFIPMAWQKAHSGMQGSEYFSNEKEIEFARGAWLEARNQALKFAKVLSTGKYYLDNHRTGKSDEKVESDILVTDGKINVTKQLCNRLLEPFMWHTTLVTSTTYSNFFELRCPAYRTPVTQLILPAKSKKECIANHGNKENIEKLQNFSNLDWLKINQGQGEIHIMALAEAMYDAYNASVPDLLVGNQWYIPFENRIDQNKLSEYLQSLNNGKFVFNADTIQQAKIEVSTSMCARTSYTVVGEDKVHSYDKDLKLHDRLLESQHYSPFEHCAKNMEDSNSYGNFTGWKQYRQFIENGEF